MVGGESIHRLDLDGPQVGLLRLICKPCLFWERARITETKEEGREINIGYICSIYNIMKEDIVFLLW